MRKDSIRGKLNIEIRVKCVNLQIVLKLDWVGRFQSIDFIISSLFV
jgi:hypothetical protein